VSVALLGRHLATGHEANRQHAECHDTQRGQGAAPNIPLPLLGELSRLFTELRTALSNRSSGAGQCRFRLLPQLR
jgi:hypothetical protein